MHIVITLKTQGKYCLEFQQHDTQYIKAAALEAETL